MNISTAELSFEAEEQSPDTRLDGVVIGILMELPNPGAPIVWYPACPIATGLPARLAAALSETDIGKDVALMFEQGAPDRPIVIGRVLGQRSAVGEGRLPNAQAVTARRPKRVVLEGEEEVVIRCGAAHIHLTKGGKVFIRGSYTKVQSSGLNRIQGAAVQIN